MLEEVGDFHEVFERGVAPVSGDGAGEGLAIAGGAMGVAKGDDVAVGGVELVVASPRVGPLLLRSSMDVEDEGIFFAHLKVDGFDDEELYVVAKGAFDPNFLDG